MTAAQTFEAISFYKQFKRVKIVVGNDLKSFFQIIFLINKL